MEELYISHGNAKLDYPTWSLPSGYTCLNSTELCRKYCYAKKAERQYEKVVVSRFRNYLTSLRTDFEDMMITRLRNGNPKLFRIHESGDFYNQDYLNKWFNICRTFPEIKFLVYSKMWNLDWSNKPNNMIVYWSIWKDTINPPANGLFAFADIGDGFECPQSCRSGCKYCFSERGNVHFRIH